jgi:hypothetical protein
MAAGLTACMLQTHTMKLPAGTPYELQVALKSQTVTVIRAKKMPCKRL